MGNAANSALGMFDWAVLTLTPSLISDIDVVFGAFVARIDVVRNTRTVFICEYALGKPQTHEIGLSHAEHVPCHRGRRQLYCDVFTKAIRRSPTSQKQNCHRSHKIVYKGISRVVEYVSVSTTTKHANPGWVSTE